MDASIFVQDPYAEFTHYLVEVIIETAESAISGEALFAFASVDGITALFEDPVMVNLLDRGPFDLVVGIDSVTNDKALEKLAQLAAKRKQLSISVYWGPPGRKGLFHPKICSFRQADGRLRSIVGSGNLTPGGLESNVEAFAVFDSLASTESAVRKFLDQNKANIGPIDNDALVRAAKNKIQGRRSLAVKGASVSEGGDPDVATWSEVEETPLQKGLRTLVAQVPAAGNRWQQIHYNADVIDKFFRVEPGTSQRVFLRERYPGGGTGPVEIRPCVLSTKNLNPKIEVSAGKGKTHPGKGNPPPVIILVERSLRNFDYTLLMPDDLGHEAMLMLSNAEPQIGKGLPRRIVKLSDVRKVWPTAPF